jgi:hypothetical protein
MPSQESKAATLDMRHQGAGVSNSYHNNYQFEALRPGRRKREKRKKKGWRLGKLEGLFVCLAMRFHRDGQA